MVTVVVPNTAPKNLCGDDQMSLDMPLGTHLHVVVELHLNYGLARSTHRNEQDMAHIRHAGVDVVVEVVQVIPNFRIDSMMHIVREDHVVVALYDRMVHLMVGVPYYCNSPSAHHHMVEGDRNQYYCGYQHVLYLNSHVLDLAKKNLPPTYCHLD